MRPVVTIVICRLALKIAQGSERSLRRLLRLGSDFALSRKRPYLFGLTSVFRPSLQTRPGCANSDWALFNSGRSDYFSPLRQETVWPRFGNIATGAMNDIRDIVALNLRRLRRERSMTQAELAFRAEVNRGYLSELESAKYAATVEMLGRLARALNVDPGVFLQPPPRWTHR